MTKKELKKYFEENFLKNTCFASLDELIKDKTTLEANMPRALIGLELMGSWRGLLKLNSEPIFDYVPKHDGD